jgi:hypothetical protein
MSDETYFLGRARQREMAIRPAAAVTCGQGGRRRMEGRQVLIDSSSRPDQFQHGVGTAAQAPLTGDLPPPAARTAGSRDHV